MPFFNPGQNTDEDDDDGGYYYDNYYDCDHS